MEPMYSKAQTDKITFLTSNGYNFALPNSYASQQALALYNQSLTAPKTTAPSAEAAEADTTATTSYSGITDETVRNALTDQYLAALQGNAPRDAATAGVNQTLQDYSKASAFADSQGLADANIQKALEAFAPGMNRGLQAAGQSGSSMQALMTQRAASDAALTSAQLQAKQATDYGNITSNLNSVLEALTRTDMAEEETKLKAAELLKTSESVPVSTSTTNTTANNGKLRVGDKITGSVGSSVSSIGTPSYRF